MIDNGELISGHEMGITCPIPAEQVPWVHDTQLISPRRVCICAGGFGRGYLAPWCQRNTFLMSPLLGR